MKASEWGRAAAGRDQRLVAALLRVYGGHADVVAGRLLRLAALAERYMAQYGDAEVVLARAPGRVNLLGRHVDHQGGCVNMIATTQDLHVMAAPRGDGVVAVSNLDRERFGDNEFTLGQAIAGFGGDWRSFVDSSPVRLAASRADGHWSHYVRAAAARFASERPVCGMNMVAAGDIPVASGLSSSSAVVVAAAEAICALNSIDLEATDFVTLCGEAEWYVGTRGGAGDHAAIKCARPEMVVQIRFFPLEVRRVGAFPAGHAVLVCPSLQSANKMTNARGTFNQRVASYHIGREFILRGRPEWAPHVVHLRDITSERLGVPLSDIIRSISEIPHVIDRGQVVQCLGEETTGRWLESHAEEVGPYRLRNVVMYGLSECARSETFAFGEDPGASARIGDAMRVSHDGDRVSGARASDGAPFPLQYADAAMQKLLAEAQCTNGLSLAGVPGSYACSTAQIDAMVDVLCAVPGVAGAQMVGAGLGGCVVALVSHAALSSATRAINEQYYDAHGLDRAAFVCGSAAGSGLLQA